jgi:DNA integrity scanning protein DisA with diadenylate cyclase activity
VIVSEQSGQVSVARGGQITQNIAFEELMQIISDAGK